MSSGLRSWLSQRRSGSSDWKIGLIIAAAAMVINLVDSRSGGGSTAAVNGQGEDRSSALAGGVVLTTITDVVGFVSFLGLATLLYA